MKIESRVEALEHELNILKNEIQSTLLEIREQVLNHYYPELRAEEAPRAKAVAAKPGNARPSKSSPAKSNGAARMQTAQSSSPAKEIRPDVLPFSDISLEELGLDMNALDDDDFDDDYSNHEMDDEMDEGIDNGFGGELDDEMEDEEVPEPRSTPKTREVVLSQLKQAPAAPKAKANGTQGKGEAKGQKPNRHSFAALAAWVGDSVAKVGKERTLQVVETYAASGGALSPETKSSILQLTSLASDEAPTHPVGNQEMLGLMVELDKLLGQS